MTEELELKKLVEDAAEKKAAEVISKYVENEKAKSLTNFVEVKSAGDKHTAAAYLIALAKSKRENTTVGEAADALIEQATISKNKAAKARFVEVKKAINTSQSDRGGVFVPEDLWTELVESLMPASFMDQLGATIIDMPHGNMTFAGIDDTVQFRYGCECEDVEVSDVDTYGIKLLAKNVSAAFEICEDWMNYAVDAAPRLLLNEISRKAELVKSASVLLGEGGSTPGGIALMAGNQLQATSPVGGYTYESVTNDLAAMIQAVEENNVSGNLVWIMNATTKGGIMRLTNALGLRPYFDEIVTSGTLFGHKIIISNVVPNNYTADPLLPAPYNTLDMSKVFLGQGSDILFARAKDLEIKEISGYAYKNANGKTNVSNNAIIRASMAFDVALLNGGKRFAVLNDCGWGNL
jgi:HK97 family phage major capsid protein